VHQEAARRLTAAFREGRVHKLYWALVDGTPERAIGEIALPLGKLSGRFERMGTGGAEDRPARTLYARIAEEKGICWLALRPLTGRTHQLRAHCALSGHPILGDRKYGLVHQGGDRVGQGSAKRISTLALPSGLLLLARELTLPHPEDGTTLRRQAPLSPALASAFRLLGFDPDCTAARRAAEALAEAV